MKAHHRLGAYSRCYLDGAVPGSASDRSECAASTCCQRGGSFRLYPIHREDHRRWLFEELS